MYTDIKHNEGEQTAGKLLNVGDGTNGEGSPPVYKLSDDQASELGILQRKILTAQVLLGELEWNIAQLETERVNKVNALTSSKRALDDRSQILLELHNLDDKWIVDIGSMCIRRKDSLKR